MPAVEVGVAELAPLVEGVEGGREVGREGLGVLPLVLRLRERVAGLELEPARQAAVQLKDERVVPGGDAAANLLNLAEARVRPGVAEVVGERPVLPAERAVNDVDGSRGGRRAQVGVNEVRQVFAAAEEVAGRGDGVARNLALKHHVGLVDHRVLEALLEVVDRRRAQGSARQDVREDGRGRVAGGSGRAGGGVHRGDDLAGAGNVRVDERLDDGRAVDAPVVDAVAGADARLAVALHVVGEAEARPPVVPIARPVGRLRQQRVNQAGEGLRQLLVLVAEAEVQRQTRRGVDVVLEEEGVVVGRKDEARRAEALLVVAGVALAREPRAGGALLVRRPQRPVRGEVGVVDDEVVDVGVDVRAGLREQLVVDLADVVDVGAPLDGLVADGVGQGVGELQAALVGQRAAVEAGGLAEGDAVGESDLRGEAVGRGRLARERRLGELRVEFLRPLEAPLVDEPARKGRGQAQVQRVGGHEVVAVAVAVARHGRRRLDARGRGPAQTVIGRREDIILVDVPIYLRQEEFLVAAPRRRPGQAVDEAQGRVDLVGR